VSEVPPPPTDIGEPRPARRLDRTALSYWFPLIEKAGLPVPCTRIFQMPDAARDVILAGMDGRDGGDGLVNFAADVAETVIADGLGFPLFLRTDHTSGKHEWNRTCFVSCPEDLSQHIWALAEFSELADFMGGMPWETIVARELLPTLPIGKCPAYRDMPICREFRIFVDGDEIICTHPYWPQDALAHGGAIVSAHDMKKLSTFRDPAEMEAVQDLARRAGAAVGGAWSVDVLDTARGWFVTDMAEAHKSWHWPRCPHEARCRKVPAQQRQEARGDG